MQKNDEFDIEITDMGSEGEGIGRHENMIFFIKGAVVGDIVHAGVTKLKKTYGYARVINLLQPSYYRTEPLCPVASRCGGCQLQNLTYEKQLDYKENKIRECLIRLGGIKGERIIEQKSNRTGDKYGGNKYKLISRLNTRETTDESDYSNVMRNVTYENLKDAVIFNSIIGMENPVHYRNKAQIPVGTDRNGRMVMGFYAGHTHTIIDINSCVIQHSISDNINHAVRQYISDGKISVYDEERNTGLIRHVLIRIGFTTGDVMVCVVINGKDLPAKNRLVALLHAEIDKYSAEAEKDSIINQAKQNKKDEQNNVGVHYNLKSVSFSINTESTNVIMGEKIVPVYGEPYIIDYIGEVRYRISPLSFYQVNPVQTVKLYSMVLEYAGLTGNEVVWDIYCGIGTISLFLAHMSKQVYGVEIVPQAIEDACENARMNNITNAEFFVGAAEEILPAKYMEDPSMRADVIVVDPPRKGCDKALLDTVVKLEPARIVYVSCDPATLARDIKYLEERDYRLKKVQGCDMFPMSGHVETVCLLSKVEADSPED